MDYETSKKIHETLKNRLLAFGAPEATNTIPSILHDLLAATVTASETTKSSDNSLENFIWDTYYAIDNAVIGVPVEHQARLVDFMVELRKSSLRNARGPILKDGERVWADVPDLGMFVRERWNFDPYDEDFTDERRIQVERRSTFLAMLTNRAGRFGDPFDFSLYALWSLRDAFEGGYEDEIKEGAGVTAAVRIAAPWVIHAGPALWKLVQAGVRGEERGGMEGPKYRGIKEWRGFEKDRWEVWRDGFVAAQNELPDLEAREIAKKAAEAMQKFSV